jgi:hypothetical protein
MGKKIDSLGSMLETSMEQDHDYFGQEIVLIIVDYARAIATTLEAMGDDFFIFASNKGGSPLDFYIREYEKSKGA